MFPYIVLFPGCDPDAPCIVYATDRRDALRFGCCRVCGFVRIPAGAIAVRIAGAPA